VVLDRRDRAGQRARIAGAELLNPGVDFGIQACKCKARATKPNMTLLKL
jgi:hypothetical protein